MALGPLSYTDISSADPTVGFISTRHLLRRLCVGSFGWWKAVPWEQDPPSGTTTRCCRIPTRRPKGDCPARWPGTSGSIASYKGLPVAGSSNPPTHSCSLLSTPPIPFGVTPCSIGQLPLWRLVGAPDWTWKDGGRGSGSPLTRAFAGSKPLLIASLPVPGLTVPTLILEDG
jgi:hypothetical protein